jgi:hypothetical protein
MIFFLKKALVPRMMYQNDWIKLSKGYKAFAFFMFRSLPFWAKMIHSGVILTIINRLGYKNELPAKIQTSVIIQNNS